MALIRFGLAGCGQVALKHTAALEKLKFGKLSAVQDSNSKRAKEFGKRYGVPYFSLYEDLLDSGIDVVSICTPSWLHSSMGIKAAERGINVLVEKPMALDLVSADELISACAKQGVCLSVVLQNRFKPAVRLLHSALENDRFGRINYGSAVIRWNRNSEYYLDNLWRGEKSLGGGTLINQAIHNLDLLVWFLGPASSICAYTANRNKLSNAEDVAVGMIRFKSGALGVVEASSCIYPCNLEESLAIFGERGSAILGGTTADEIKTWLFQDGTRDDLSVIEQSFNGHLEVYKDLIRAIKTNGKPLVDGEEGKKSLALILALHLSAAEKREVILD